MKINKKTIIILLFVMVLLVLVISYVTAILGHSSIGINITYPVNDTTYTTTSIDLNWSINITPTNCAYRLDDGDNKTGICSPKDLKQVSSFTNTTLSSAGSVIVIDNLAYVTAVENDSLTIINVTDKKNPKQISSFTNSSSMHWAYGLDVIGDYAYVASPPSQSLTIINVTDKKNPYQVSSFTNTSFYFREVKVLGDYAYLVSVAADSLIIINVSDKHNPKQISSFTNSSSIDAPFSVEVIGDYAFITSDGNDSLTIINVTDKKNPKQISSFTNSSSMSYAETVKVHNNIAYVTGAGNDSLTLINVTDKKNPKQISSFVNHTSLKEPWGFFITDDYAYVTTTGTPPFVADYLTIIDITDKKNPYQVSSFLNITMDEAKSVFVLNNYVYVASPMTDSLTIINVTMKANNITLSDLSEGEHNITIWANDSDGNIGQSDYTFFTINLPPTTPTLTFPDDLAGLSLDWTWLNFTSTNPTEGENITYYIYADTNNPPLTLVVNVTNYTYYNYSGLTDGNYYWRVMAGDNYTNTSNSSIRSFSVTTTAPSITIYYPPFNNSWNNSDTSILMSFKVDDDGDTPQFCELYGNWSKGWHLNQTLDVTSLDNIQTNFSAVNLDDEEKYFYNVWCNDTAGNSAWYPFGNITFGVDTILPNLTVTSPTTTTYTTTTVTLTLIASDTFLDSCFYNLYYKDTLTLKDGNTTFTCTTGATLTTPYYSGGYMLNVYANDSAGNINTTQVNFTTEAAAVTPPSPGGGGAAPTPPSNETSIINFGTTNLIFTVLSAPITTQKQLLIKNIGSKTFKGNLEVSENLQPVLTAQICDISLIVCGVKNIEIKDGESAIMVIDLDVDPTIGEGRQGIIKMLDDNDDVFELPVSIDRVPGYKIQRWVGDNLRVDEQTALVIFVIASISALAGLAFVAHLGGVF